MKKHDARGRSMTAPQHVRLHFWVLKSPAYRSLSLAARSLLVELYALYNGTNNGDLFLSCRDAGDRLGASKSLASLAFRELTQKGFIKARQHGAFSMKIKPKLATTWVLTEFGYHDQLSTKEFMQWRPVEIQNTVHPRGQNVHPGGQIENVTVKNTPSVHPRGQIRAH